MLRRRCLLGGTKHIFEPDVNTVALFHFDGNLKDECNNLSINTGSATVTYNQSLCEDEGQSVRLQSATAYIPSFYLNSNFTIEFWIKSYDSSNWSWKFQFDGVSGTNLRSPSNVANDRIMVCQNGGKIYFTHPNNTNYTSTATSTAEHHIAIVRIGDKLKFFIDGSLFKEVTFMSSCTYWLPLFSSMCGFDELRISNIARYTKNFTVPTIGNSEVEVDYEAVPLTFVGGPYTSTNLVLNGNTEVSYNNGATWSSSGVISIYSGQKTMVRATITPQAYAGVGTFSVTGGYGTFSVEGNAMSLIYGGNFYGQRNLSSFQYGPLLGLFANLTQLTSAENLILPATTLQGFCYCQMFYGCTSLTVGPTLPAATLPYYCYNAMFYNCSSLKKITCLTTSTNPMSQYGTAYWVYGVGNTGTFVKASGSSWTTGSDGIPSGWTTMTAIY